MPGVYKRCIWRKALLPQQSECLTSFVDHHAFPPIVSRVKQNYKRFLRLGQHLPRSKVLLQKPRV